MKKTRLGKSEIDKTIADLAYGTPHRWLAIWAADCAERVISFFEEKRPEDSRPRLAIDELRMWIKTSRFSMNEVRRAALGAHAAAREVGEFDAARSAARAAGQALATAHVPAHAIAAAIYAATAVRDAASLADADAALARERRWQYHRLLELIENSTA